MVRLGWLALLVLLALAPRAAAQEVDAGVYYVCPMDAGVRRAEPGKCPRCGMALVATRLAELRTYGLAVETWPRVVRPGERFTLRLGVRAPDGGRVRDFARVHERLLHLFVVGADLEFFAHEHPVQEPDGDFTLALALALPRAGRYHVVADFFPVGGLPQVVQRVLLLANAAGVDELAPARLVPDRSWTRAAGGVRFTIAETPLVAGKPAVLEVRLADATTGAPITDLKPWLGATLHAVAIAEDLADVTHVHGEPPPGEPDRVRFAVRFPRPGRYRMWLQAERRGAVLTVPFTVAVEARGARLPEELPAPPR